MASGRRAAGPRPAGRRRPGARCGRPCPEGASTLFGWCSSTTSTEGKKRAASCANFISSTAPMPKLGAMTTPTSGLGSSHSATVASLASSKPVVPTTQWMFWSMQKRMLSMTTSGPGEVDDDLGAGVGDVEQPVAVVDHRDELEVVGGVDRLDHLGAHPAPGAEHPDVDERGLARRGAESDCWSGAGGAGHRGQASRQQAPGCKTAPFSSARRAGRRALPGEQAQRARRRRRPASRPPTAAGPAAVIPWSTSLTAA